MLKALLLTEPVGPLLTSPTNKITVKLNRAVLVKFQKVIFSRFQDGRLHTLTQYPVLLSYALTVYRVQGLTLCLMLGGCIVPCNSESL